MQDTWEKRLAYVQVVVELIAKSSENQATHDTSYTEPISHLFETAVDIAVQGKHLLMCHSVSYNIRMTIVSY